MAEAKLVINRDPAAPPPTGDPNRFAGAKAAQAVNADAVRARRKQIHEQARIDATGPGIKPDPEAPADPPPAREPLESIEFTAPNGLVIEYGPRSDISLVDRIARIYNQRDPTIAEFRLTRVLMGIRNINGKPPVTVVDEITRTKLANLVGDEVIDMLMYYDRLHWPPLQVSELPVIRKNLRT
jgi:hypothetical protein